jgi:L-threonylcarbamoyladenylate synthase
VLVESEAEMLGMVVDLRGSGERVGMMLPDGWAAGMEGREFRWGPWGDREALARRLFAGLRELDEAGVSVIVCPVPEAGGLGDALRDRLRKAAWVK